MTTTTRTNATTTHVLDWPTELALQFSSHWESRLRPRLAGLTDEEYFWEPVPGCWSVRPRGQGVASLEVGKGDLIVDWAKWDPDPAPVTTIAWRLAHLIVGVFGERNARYFGGAPISDDSHQYAGTAAAALAELDEQVDRWITGVRGLDLAGLTERCREPGHEADSMAALVLHIHREGIHHGAEVALLRDLFAAGGSPRLAG
jgi:DinB superfamily